MHFGVIGRIQLKHESGLWNEWHILFDDGRSAWLSEAGGEYVVNAQVAVGEAIPAFENQADRGGGHARRARLQGHQSRQARCIAGEGELPFKVDAGYDVECGRPARRRSLRDDRLQRNTAAGLRRLSGTVQGTQITNLREQRDVAAGGPNVKAQAFNCPHCASPLTIHSPAIEASAAELRLDHRRREREAAPAFAGRPEGALRSRRSARQPGPAEGYRLGSDRLSPSVPPASRGVDYFWNEYLLHNPGKGSPGWSRTRGTGISRARCRRSRRWRAASSKFKFDGTVPPLQCPVRPRWNTSWASSTGASR